MNEKKLIKCKYFIDDNFYEVTYNASIKEGQDVVQYDRDFDLLKKSKFRQNGFFVSSFLHQDEFNLLSNYVTKKIQNILSELNIDIKNFSLSDYHNFVTNTQHIEVINKMISIKEERLIGIDINEIPIDLNKIEKKVSGLLNYNMSFNNTPVFYIRIVRPKSHDNNPPHRDTNLERLRNLINLYIPIAGSNIRSSLSLAPESHLLSDKDFYIIEDADVINSNINSKGYNTKFTVPGNIPKIPLKMIRPNPKLNEFLIFTPYLIHGGAANNSEETRVSLEMRLHRKDE